MTLKSQYKGIYCFRVCVLAKTWKIQHDHGIEETTDREDRTEGATGRWIVKDILHHNKEGLFFMVGSEKTMEIHKQGNEIIGFLLNLFTLVIKLWIK